MARVVKFLLVFIFLAVVVVGAYSLYQNREPEDQGFILVDVTRGDITEKAVAVGQIEPRQRFHIKSKISGIVKRCAVEVGDQVRPGDPLIEITPDPTPLERLEAERRVETAQSAYKRAEADWTRSQELVSKGVESRNTLDAMVEAYELAGIESIIRAPAAGIVLQRLVNNGDPVVPLTSYQEGTELATLADMSDLMFKGTVDEIDVGKLTVGMPARLKIGALPDQEITGRLSRIAPQAIEEDNAKLFEVEIELDPTDGVLLRAGYSANADLVIREKTGILLIPERLVIFEEEGAKRFVELSGEGPEAEPRKVEIETGLSDGLNIEVTEGLSEEDQLVQRPPREISG